MRLKFCKRCKAVTPHREIRTPKHKLRCSTCERETYYYDNRKKTWAGH